MLFIYLFAFISSFAFGNIVRLPCKSLARFDVVLDGFAITGVTAVATHHQVTRRQCVLHCISNTQCKCVNYNTLASVCEVFGVRFYDVAQGLVVRSGWSFLAATDESGKCITRQNPCANNGTCVESCEPKGYSCVCREYYFGASCEDDIQSILDRFCSSYPGTVARYDGQVTSVHVHYWRCYGTHTLTADGMFWSAITIYYATRHYEIVSIIKQHLHDSEYIVGALNQTCFDACKALGKTCTRRIETINSVYTFQLAGIRCKIPRSPTTDLSPYYTNMEDPCYKPSDGFCYGFLKAHFINCGGVHLEKRRLCRCL